MLRLRTLNFTDALKRYLTAPNNIIRQFALSILAIIFIEEATPVFESDETSSQDLSKSRNATRNWQKVVTKLTELFAKEVDNMNGTVWKGEDGTYKKHVLSFLRLAQEIHFELGKHNAPLEYVRQSAKDFARVLVDANIAPKICDVMVDLNQNIPVITDNEEHELISRFARAVLVSNTDCSVDFAEQVVNVPGFLEFLRDKLSLASEEHLQLHKQVRSRVVILHIYIKTKSKGSQMNTESTKLGL